MNRLVASLYKQQACQRLPYAALLAALLVVCSSTATLAQTNSLHQQATSNARSGHFDSAIAVLRRLVDEYPQQVIYQHDLVAVLSWAERHTEAIAASVNIPLNSQVPDYVLLAIAKSALQNKQPQLAHNVYRMLNERRPQDADVVRGMSLAQAALDSAQRLPTTAEPNRNAARQAAPDQPAADTLSQAQVRNAENIRAAQTALETDFTLHRYRLADAALLENAALIAQARASQNPDVLTRLKRDRIVALRIRGLNALAINEFQALDSQEPAVPAYVVAAAASANLSLRQPHMAVELYQRALRAEPLNSAWRLGLIFAYLETENFPAAERIAELNRMENANASAARRTHALLLRFADRLDEAQAATDALFEEYPKDAGIWVEQGDLLMRRGLPRAAALRYEATLVAEPGHVRARVGLAEAWWAQGALNKADQLISQLQTDAPEHPAVVRLLDAWAKKARPRLTSGITHGFGHAQVSGNDDKVWESTLFTGQNDGGWRGFASHHQAHATFDGRSVNHERFGIGVEWTAPDFQGTVEIGQDLRNGKDTAWAAGAAWQLNDQFSVRAKYESQTNDFPLKGRLPDAQNYLGAPTYLHANKQLLGVAYRWNEGRRAAADFAKLAFNDGNRRQSVSASWFERLYSAYGKSLDLQLAAYTSSNTLRDAFYFNPQRDTALSATLTSDWLTWRRYDRSFNQRFSLTIGQYKQNKEIQQNQITGRANGVWNDFQQIGYEHEWQWGSDFSSRYGVGVRRFPYDGVNETKSHVFFFFNWRL